MSSPAVRQRGQKEKKAPASAPTSPKTDGDLNGILKDTKLPAVVTSEWNYKLALGVITLLAFITRFWGIGHPNEVVFDEVHFGKVCKAASFAHDPTNQSFHAKSPSCRLWTRYTDYALW